jgi:SAM-dependent methyltransferase
MSTPSRPPFTVDNPAFNYDQSGHDYSGVRRADPRIAAEIHAALGEAKTVLNVGAGSGSYEPVDRYVVPLEPSNVMRSQRPRHLAPALIGTADDIPFDDGAFDASMVVLSVHHWTDRSRCLREIRRVTRGPVVVMTFDPDAPTQFWMGDYAPELVAIEKQRYGPLESVTAPLRWQCSGDSYRRAARLSRRVSGRFLCAAQRVSGAAGTSLTVRVELSSFGCRGPRSECDVCGFGVWPLGGEVRPPARCASDQVPAAAHCRHPMRGTPTSAELASDETAQPGVEPDGPPARGLTPERWADGNAGGEPSQAQPSRGARGELRGGATPAGPVP